MLYHNGTFVRLLQMALLCDFRALELYKNFNIICKNYIFIFYPIIRLSLPYLSIILLIGKLRIENWVVFINQYFSMLKYIYILHRPFRQTNLYFIFLYHRALIYLSIFSILTQHTIVYLHILQSVIWLSIVFYTIRR